MIINDFNIKTKRDFEQYARGVFDTINNSNEFDDITFDYQKSLVKYDKAITTIAYDFRERSASSKLMGRTNIDNMLKIEFNSKFTFEHLIRILKKSRFIGALTAEIQLNDLYTCTHKSNYKAYNSVDNLCHFNTTLMRVSNQGDTASWFASRFMIDLKQIIGLSRRVCDGDARSKFNFIDTAAIKAEVNGDQIIFTVGNNDKGKCNPFVAARVCEQLSAALYAMNCVDLSGIIHSRRGLYRIRVTLKNDLINKGSNSAAPLPVAGYTPLPVEATKPASTIIQAHIDLLSKSINDINEKLYANGERRSALNDELTELNNSDTSLLLEIVALQKAFGVLHG